MALRCERAGFRDGDEARGVLEDDRALPGAGSRRSGIFSGQSRIGEEDHDGYGYGDRENLLHLNLGENDKTFTVRAT